MVRDLHQTDFFYRTYTHSLDLNKSVANASWTYHRKHRGGQTQPTKSLPTSAKPTEVVKWLEDFTYEKGLKLGPPGFFDVFVPVCNGHAFNYSVVPVPTPLPLLTLDY
jgi:hypothetical protein